MSEIFIHKTRGSIVECMHRGDAVVTSPGGEILALSGDAYKYTYFRSSAKPMQALNVILSGAAERFGLSDEELAVICSSHYAEDCHLQAVRSILAKCGLTVADLQSGVARSIRPEIAFAQAEAGIQPMRLLSDCSGKHSGMLATCIARGYPIQGYLNPSHPVQQEILRIIADICLYPIEKIGIGVDGCNVAVFALPIYNMAAGFARLANPDYLPQAYKSPAIQIFRSMTTHPKMVSGTGGFCTALMHATKGRMIGKIGAQGVYCIGIREPELGIALKIEDGAPGTASLAAMHILRELDLLSDDEYQELEQYHHPAILNDDGLIVGEVRAVFGLQINSASGERGDGVVKC